MTGCVHRVRWSVRPPEDCRFRLSVSHYKDRIVAPDEYTGATVVTPSDQTQVLETKDKLVREDITVEGITGTQVITQNGEYDVVGDKSVTVDVYPTEYSDDPKNFSGGNILALRSHGREWINTGYYPKEIVDISCCISKSAEETASQHGGILSVMFPSNRIGNQFVTTYIDRIYYYDGTGNMPTQVRVSENPTQFFNRMCRISMPDGQFEVASKPLIIFYTYRGAGYDKLGAFTFYGLKCYEFSKLKKYYVPWLDENNVPCVHELVDDEYCYNVGTGNFGYIDLEGNVHDAT